jgi:hypothetical protein
MLQDIGDEVRCCVHTALAMKINILVVFFVWTFELFFQKGVGTLFNVRELCFHNASGMKCNML